MTAMTPARKRLAGLLLVLLAVAAFSFWPRGGGEGEARPSSRPGRRGASDLSADAVPRLALNQGRGELSAKVERNIFAFYVRPTPVPPTPPPVPTPLPAPCTPLFVGPCLPPPPPRPTPIVVPAIPYRAVGIFGPRERPIVAFEDGARLINAREGDVLDGRFVLRKVNRESVDFGFVGLPPDVSRRVPVLPPDFAR